MPKEKNQHKSAAASDEKFRDFFTTTVADIPAEMVRREEEAAEEHKGLFGRLFGHAKPKQAPQAGTDLELPTGEVLLGADALAKPDGEEPLDLDLTLRTADPGTDFPQPKAEVPAAPEKPAVPDKPAPQPAPENKPEPPKAPAAPAPQPEKPRKKAAQNPKNAPDVLLPQEQQEQQEMQQLKDMLNGMAAKPKPVEETLEPIRSVDVPLDDPEEPETPEKAPEPPRPTMVFAADKPLPKKKSVFRMFGDADDEKKPEVPEEPAAPEKTSPAEPVKAPEAEPETKPDEDTMSLPLEPLDAPETEPTETPVAAPAADAAEAEHAGETELKTEAEDALPAEDEAPESVGEKLRRMSAELTLRCVLAGILAVVLLHVGLVADRLLPPLAALDPDAAPAAVLGQGRDAPDAPHFAGAAVKLHGEIGDGEGTHHFPVLVEGRPVGGVVLLRVGGTVGVGHFKADGEQLVDSPGFLQSGFPHDHFSSSSGSM